MKTHLIIISAASILMATSCGRKEKNTSSRPVPEIEVATPVTAGVTDFITIPGTVVSDSKVDVVCRVDGRLLTKHFNPGDRVSKGQLLFTMESTTYRDAVQRQTAALATARSQYDYAVRHAEALKKAYEADAVAKMQVLEAENAVTQAAASVKSAEAALNDARTQLGYCSITAPISGVISDTQFSSGSFISGEGNPTVMASIVNNDDLKVVFSIENSEYRSLPSSDDSLYNSLPLTFREPLESRYTARLSYKSPSVDSSTGLLTLQGRILNPSGELRDGMYCTISLPLGYNPEAILVKDASIGSDQLGKYLYVVSGSDKIVKRHIATGELWQDSMRVVKSGITPSERYVVKALLSVREGEKIHPVDVSSK